jgi:hypothetical protein
MSMQQNDPPSRDAKGKFVLGNVPTAHRRKGSKNKLTRSVKEMLNRAAAAVGGEAGIEGLIEDVARKRPEIVLGYLIHANVPKATESDEDAPTVSITNEVSIIAVPPGGQVEPEVDQIVYPDGVRIPSPPHAGFVPTPEIPETDPVARVEQLERRVELLEARNEYLECLLNPLRAQPTLPGSKPQLVVDNNGEVPGVA